METHEGAATGARLGITEAQLDVNTRANNGCRWMHYLQRKNGGQGRSIEILLAPGNYPEVLVQSH